MKLSSAPHHHQLWPAADILKGETEQLCRVDHGVGVVSTIFHISPELARAVLQVKMVTGDQLAIAVETSRRLGLGTNIIEGKDVTFESHRVSPELAHQVIK